MVEIVIDIASKTIRMARRSSGHIMQESALAAVTHDGKKLNLTALGLAVKNRLGELAPGELPVDPIKDGKIAHERAATLLFQALFERVVPRRFIIKPRVKAVALISSALQKQDKLKIEQVLLNAGASSVVLVESPFAAAAVIDKSHYLLVDIGGTKTEIALLSGGKIVAGITVGLGGDAVNTAISDYLTDTHGLVIKNLSAERLKRTLGTLFAGDVRSANMGGMRAGDHAPYNVVVSADELTGAITPIFEKLAEGIEGVLDQTPEKIAMEVYESGIQLFGGGALVEGVVEYFEKRTKMPTHLLKSPENVNITGGLKLIEDRNALAGVLNLDKV